MRMKCIGWWWGLEDEDEVERMKWKEWGWGEEAPDDV